MAAAAASGSGFALDPSTSGRPSSRQQIDLNPLIVLGTAAAAKELAVRQLLDAAVEGDVPRARKWGRRLQGSGEGVEAAPAAISNPKHKRHGCLHLASAIGDEKMCGVLIKGYKVDVNATDASGATPLIFAIKGMQSIPVVTLLINGGADPNKADTGRVTPLHMAAQQDAYEIAEFLLTHGSFVDPISEDGESPLHIAAKNGNGRMLKLLLKHNGNVISSSFPALLGSLH